MRFKLFLGYMLFVTIQISLMCQKLDLIEIESETQKCQLYGHNVGQPVSSIILLSTTALSDILVPFFMAYLPDCWWPEHLVATVGKS